MDTLSYKTLSVNKENADKKWWLVDAEGQTLGRMASKVAKVLIISSNLFLAAQLLIRWIQSGHFPISNL